MYTLVMTRDTYLESFAETHAVREDTAEPVTHFISLNRLHQVIIDEPDPSDLQLQTQPRVRFIFNNALFNGLYSTPKWISIVLNVHYFLAIHTPADEHLLIALYTVRSSHIKDQGARYVI